MEIAEHLGLSHATAHSWLRAHEHESAWARGEWRGSTYRYALRSSPERFPDVKAALEAAYNDLKQIDLFLNALCGADVVFDTEDLAVILRETWFSNAARNTKQRRLIECAFHRIVSRTDNARPEAVPPSWQVMVEIYASPMGTEYSRDDIRQVVAWANRHNLINLRDDTLEVLRERDAVSKEHQPDQSTNVNATSSP